jgi:hypothetical protein
MGLAWPEALSLEPKPNRFCDTCGSGGLLFATRGWIQQD